MATYLNWKTTDITITAGEDITWNFQVRDADGAVVNIAGWTFGAWFVDQHDSSNIIIVSAGDFTLTDSANGKARFTVGRSTTTSQGGKIFRGTIWRTNSGSQDEVAMGNLKILRTVRP